MVKYQIKVKLFSGVILEVFNDYFWGAYPNSTFLYHFTYEIVSKIIFIVNQ